MGNILRKVVHKNDSNCEDKRDSFSERVCDDLSEVILQFLSLEDKLKLEGVSKQFQRTVFQRQYELRNDYTTHQLFEKITVQSFVSVLKKCPNITSLHLINNFGILNTNSISNEWLDVIIQCCPELTRINLQTCILFNKTVDKYIESVGPRLKYFECQRFNFENGTCSKVLDSLKNVQELKLNRFEFHSVLDYRFPKLRKLTIRINHENSENILKLIHNNPGINSLFLTVDINDPGSAIPVLMKLSRLKNLVHFKFTAQPLNLDVFEEVLPLMADNCPQLKSIVCQLNSDLKNFYEINGLFKRFKHLNRLDLCVSLVFDKQVYFSIIDKSYSIEPVTGLDQLTHLTLAFKGVVTAEVIDELIVSFATNSTKLRYLEVKTRNIPSKRITALLKRLSSLETLILNLNCFTHKTYHSVNNKITKLLLKHCKNIKHIKVNWE